MTDTSGNRKRIGIDLDDVLLDLNTALCAYHNARYATSFSKEDTVDYDLWNLWGCSREEVFRRVEDFYDSPEHLGSTPIPGSVEAVSALAKRYDLFLVTAKPERLRDMTEWWIDRHFPGMFRELRFTGGYRREPGTSVRKSDICRELGICTFVDDALSNVHDLAPVMDRVFLLDSPWNRQEVPYPSVTRVFSWQEILDRVA